MELVFERRSRGLSEPEKPSTPPWSGSPRHRLQAVANTNCHGLGFSHGARGAKRAAAMLVSSVLFGGEGCLVGRNFLMGCGALSIVGVLGIVAVGCLAILGNTGSNTAGTGSGGPTATEEPGELAPRVPLAPKADGQEAEPAAPEPTPEPEPIALSGVGQQATEAFELKPGLVVAALGHQGQGYFSVTLLDGNGQMADLFGNGVGPFDGSAAYGAVGGTYLLDVQADGPWTVTIRQPRPADAPETRAFQGQSAAASDPFSLPQGLSRFDMLHQGQGYFSATLLDSDGNMVDLLGNGTGNFQGSTAVSVPQDGIYVLDVQADGPWTIERQ